MSSAEFRQSSAHMSSAVLLDALNNMLSFHDSFAALNECCSVWPKVVAYAEHIDDYPALLEGLSRLHSQSQMDFERGLFCAWVSLLVASKLNLSVKRQRAVFIAGLAQDIGNYESGMNSTSYLDKLKDRFGLHATEDKLFSSGQRQQGHALLSSSMVEVAIPDDPNIAELVLHHHADEYGTGYPRNVGESQLSIDMQILIVANRLCDKLQSEGDYEALFNCIASVKLASAMHFMRVNGAYYTLLSTAKELLQGEGQNELNSEQVSNSPRLLKQVALVRELSEEAIKLSGELIPYEHISSVRLIRSKIKKLDLFISETGLLYQLDADACEHEVKLCMDALPEFLSPWTSLLHEAQKRLPASHRNTVLSVNALLAKSLSTLKVSQGFSLFV